MKCITASDRQRQGSERPKIFFDDKDDAATDQESVFFVDAEPVTEGDYERCRRADICPEKEDGARAPDMVPEQPALGLSRVGAQAYCRGLNKRLPRPDEAFIVEPRRKLETGDLELYCVVNADMRARIDQSGRLPYSAQLSRVIGRSQALNNAKGKRRKKGRKSRRRAQCRRACRRGEPWISCDPVFAENFGRPPKKNKSGFVIDDTYKDNKRVELILRGLATSHPDITELMEIGRSHQGRSIWGLRVYDKSTTKSRPAVLLNGGHHGDELLAVDYAIDALQDLLVHRRQTPQKRWISELDIVFVPLVNPDGNHHTLFRSCKNNIGRKNGRDLNLDGRFSSGEGVDLNRNYPFRWGYLGEVGSKSQPEHHHYRGARPASEPETKAMMELSDRFKFVAAFSWHTNGRLILTPYTIRKVRNLRPDLPKKAANYLRRSLSGPNHQGFKVKKDMYPVDGVDQDWHLHQNGTLAYIIEGSHHNPQDLAVRRESVRTIRLLCTAPYSTTFSIRLASPVL